MIKQDVLHGSTRREIFASHAHRCALETSCPDLPATRVTPWAERIVDGQFPVSEGTSVSPRKACSAAFNFIRICTPISCCIPGVTTTAVHIVEAWHALVSSQSAAATPHGCIHRCLVVNQNSASIFAWPNPARETRDHLSCGVIVLSATASQTEVAGRLESSPCQPRVYSGRCYSGSIRPATPVRSAQRSVPHHASLCRPAALHA